MTGYIKSDNNADNPQTKTVTAGERRDRLVGHLPLRDVGNGVSILGG